MRLLILRIKIHFSHSYINESTRRDEELQEAARDVVGALPTVHLLPHDVHDEALNDRLQGLIPRHNSHVQQIFGVKDHRDLLLVQGVLVRDTSRGGRAGARAGATSRGSSHRRRGAVLASTFAFTYKKII